MADIKPAIIHCRRCGVGVAEDKVNAPDRCNDENCTVPAQYDLLLQSRARPRPTPVQTVLDAG